MGWSSKQVWGFTSLMLGVVITMIVSMVTLALFLTMGEPPEGQTLLIATPTTTPTTEAPPLLAACVETPEDAFIFLPQSCAIVTSSPTSPSSVLPSVEFRHYYNMRQCSNHMCHGDSCHGDRCCCQVIQTSSLAYYCPNEEGVLVHNIVEKCGCAPCTDVQVVFVGTVTNTENKPIPLATVTVDHTHSYQANEDAIFGFSVSSLQDQVVVIVTARGYSQYNRLLRVLPGEVNVLQVQLMRIMIRSIPATSHSLIVSTLNLEWGTLTSNLSTSTPLRRVRVETLIQFPSGVFSESLTVIGQPVAMDNLASLEGLDMSFVTGNVSDEVRRRREVGGEEEKMVFVVSVAMLDLQKEEGERMSDKISGIISHTIFPPAGHSCSDLTSLHLYLMTGSTLLPVVGGNTSCSESETQTQLTISLPHPVSPPINLVLGSPHSETCYLAVRAFESFTGSLASNEIISVRVWLHTQQTGPPRMVNIMVGRTGECVSIPCHGELEVRILDGLQYDPESYRVYLDNDVIMTSDDVAAEAEVYSNKSECEEKALGPAAEKSSYFLFVVKPRQPTIMGQPTPNNANLTTPPFCSLRVGVAFPGGVASVYVMASSEVGEEGKMVRVERVGDGDVEEEEEGGSGMCRNCKKEENLHACLQVSCDHQIEVGVSRVDGRGVCMPQREEGVEEVEVEGEKIRLGEEGKVAGLVVDPYSSDPSIAMEMCKLMSETSVWFYCNE